MFEFDSIIEQRGFGKLTQCVVILPQDLVNRLPLEGSKRLRLHADINGVPFDAAIMPAGKGKWFIMVSKKLQKKCGLTIGDTATIEFELADPNRLNVPAELSFALEANDRAMAIWNQWTVGKRRSYCYIVDSAKMSPTREKRAQKVIDILLEEEDS